MNKTEFAACYRAHFQTVWNVCYTCLRNPADTEDAVQETFLRLARCGKRFRDREHEKAWLIVTAGNVCKDEFRRRGRQNLSLEQVGPVAAPDSPGSETMEALLALPEHYRQALYLFYYEDLSTKEIAKVMKRPEATVRSLLHRGRKLLKARLEGEA